MSELGDMAYREGRRAVEVYARARLGAPPLLEHSYSLTGLLVDRSDPTPEEMALVEREYNKGRADALAAYRG